MKKQTRRGSVSVSSMPSIQHEKPSSIPRTNIENAGPSVGIAVYVSIKARHPVGEKDCKSQRPKNSAVKLRLLYLLGKQPS